MSVKRIGRVGVVREGNPTYVNTTEGNERGPADRCNAQPTM